MSADIRILKARRILTMNSYRPVGTHVAIRDGRILGVGTPGGPRRLGSRRK